MAPVVSLSVNYSQESDDLFASFRFLFFRKCVGRGTNIVDDYSSVLIEHNRIDSASKWTICSLSAHRLFRVEEEAVSVHVLESCIALLVELHERSLRVAFSFQAFDIFV